MLGGKLVWYKVCILRFPISLTSTLFPLLFFPFLTYSFVFLPHHFALSPVLLSPFLIFSFIFDSYTTLFYLLIIVTSYSIFSSFPFPSIPQHLPSFPLPHFLFSSLFFTVFLSHLFFQSFFSFLYILFFFPFIFLLFPSYCLLPPLTFFFSSLCNCLWFHQIF